jgi:hypothetical protein
LQATVPFGSTRTAAFRGRRISIARLKLGSTWSVFPKTTFTLKTGNTQLVGIGETGDSGPFDAKSADRSIA